MTTIHHHLTIEAPVATVYQAIATPDGVSTWWDKQTPVESDRGLVLEHNPGPEHGIVQLLVVDLQPNRRVEWECVSRHPQSSPASVWTGTHFIFELAAAAGGDGRATDLDFRQTGYDERSPFLPSNTEAWGAVLRNLKQTVEGSA